MRRLLPPQISSRATTRPRTRRRTGRPPTTMRETEGSKTTRSRRRMPRGDKNGPNRPADTETSPRPGTRPRRDGLPAATSRPMPAETRSAERLPCGARPRFASGDGAGVTPAAITGAGSAMMRYFLHAGHCQIPRNPSQRLCHTELHRAVEARRNSRLRPAAIGSTTSRQPDTAFELSSACVWLCSCFAAPARHVSFAICAAVRSPRISFSAWSAAASHSVQSIQGCMLFPELHIAFEGCGRLLQTFQLRHFSAQRGGNFLQTRQAARQFLRRAERRSLPKLRGRLAKLPQRRIQLLRSHSVMRVLVELIETLPPRLDAGRC